jgi:hypothetical protein
MTGEKERIYDLDQLQIQNPVIEESPEYLERFKAKDLRVGIITLLNGTESHYFTGNDWNSSMASSAWNKELQTFDFAPVMAIMYKRTNDRAYVDHFVTWYALWMEKYQGRYQNKFKNQKESIEERLENVVYAEKLMKPALSDEFEMLLGKSVYQQYQFINNVCFWTVKISCKPHIYCI